MSVGIELREGWGLLEGERHKKVRENFGCGPGRGEAVEDKWGQRKVWQGVSDRAVRNSGMGRCGGLAERPGGGCGFSLTLILRNRD